MAWTTSPPTLRGSAPGPGRRLGVLADHLVAGTKESRIAATVSGAARPGRRASRTWTSGKRSGPPPWASRPGRMCHVGWIGRRGVCDVLGVRDTATMWGRVNGAVRSYRDLATPLLTAVESLIDFVTAEPED